ncbi:MAG TPA: M20/M25/M40 family metallo-hydrolase [Pyrinomonadaceae bacterium]|nr:M20/M25/M40 family metallo-hydrolase [Pyrinomonadaceae bacterium]
MRRQFLSLSLILAIAFSAIAQQRANDSAPSVERLRAHINYLASDKLEGRRTGSAGANLAAEYIAREFARYMSVLEADFPHRYMQEFPFIAGVDLGKSNSMLFTPHSQSAASQDKASAAQTGARAASLDLRLGEDWMPLGFSSNANVTNSAAVFVGYGMKVDAINYNDYADAPVQGRIAIALSGTPDGDNPHGHFAQYADVRWKAIAAREQNASALVIIASEENFKDDRLSQLRYDNSSGEAGLPVVVISRQAAQRIFEASGLAPVAAMEKAAQGFVKTLLQPSATERRKNLSVPLKDVTLSITTDIARRSVPAYNVVGILDGSDPVLKNEAIVIGAHYDHLGRGGEGSLAPREGEIHHGADDNASGVAGLLELARIFHAERAKLKRTIVFIAFSGEEEGLLGSNYYVNHPIWPLDKTVAMINMDMIGRMKDNKLIISGVGTAKEWRGWIDFANFQAASVVPYIVAPSPNVVSSPSSPPKPAGSLPQWAQRDINFPVTNKFVLTLNEDGYGPSDHSSFYAKKIPVLFFFTGTHDDYHKPSDTAEKINYEDEARVITFVEEVARRINFNPQRPTYTVAKSESQGGVMSFNVYLGTIPNYADSDNGLTLDGVREDSPAAKAGLKAGDRIIRIAGRQVRNVYDYTYALGEMKAGQVYEVEIVRGAETLKLKITPAARK